jgi:hypothetical protein
MSDTPSTRPAFPPWASEFARVWNGGAHSVFVLHGNIHDLQPVPTAAGLDYGPLAAFFARRLFPERAALMFYDLGQGLTFADGAMRQHFFEWLQVYDDVEHTSWHSQGLPRELPRLLPILRRFFLQAAEASTAPRGATLVINFPEKLMPAADESGASIEERTVLVTLLTWAASPELLHADVGLLLVTETLAELHPDLLQNPHVARVRLDLPDVDARRAFLESGWTGRLANVDLPSHSDLSIDDLARRSSGLSLLQLDQFLRVCLRNNERITTLAVGAAKRRLIEDYCAGLVRFKDPKPGLSLDTVATHTAAKARLRELAWLIREHKLSVLERGVLVPGRIGVGKTFLIDCFASECGLPVLEIGEFRSKWVGETERQQARILLTIRALGPVIVVVDEADAVFGDRSASGDSGVSSRVFAAFAAHLGDSSLRGRELWIAMTSRPDLLAIDLRRQGRFGLCIPLFAAQSPDEVVELFEVIARTKKIPWSAALSTAVRTKVGDRALTGSDVEALLVRSLERAVLARRDEELRETDLIEAIESFIDPLDPDLLALQELAAVRACSDRRLLPPKYAVLNRENVSDAFEAARRVAR